jgi:hypothetical protein
MYINGLKPTEANPAAEAATLSRIQPAGAVFAGATGAAAQAAAARAAADAAKGQVAYDGTLDGSVIFGNLCTGATPQASPRAQARESGLTACIAQGVEVLHTMPSTAIPTGRRRHACARRQSIVVRRAGQGHGRLDAHPAEVSDPYY